MEKFIRENAFEQKKKKPGLTRNSELIFVDTNISIVSH